MKIQTTSVEQTANELMGTPAKKLYYLLIENTKGQKLTINVGQKTHDQVLKLVQEEEEVQQLSIAVPPKQEEKPTIEKTINKK